MKEFAKLTSGSGLLRLEFKFSIQLLSADSNLSRPLIMDSSWFNNAILHKFEHSSFFIPEGFDPLLHLCYGDYMTPPPKEKQLTHHSFKAYWRR